MGFWESKEREGRKERGIRLDEIAFKEKIYYNGGGHQGRWCWRNGGVEVALYRKQVKEPR